MKSWDPVQRCYVERSDDVANAMETFGTLGAKIRKDEISSSEVQEKLSRIVFGPRPPANSNAPVAAQPERKGDWMQTYTGRQFWPLDPDPAHIAIEDIAHALAMSCRYGGHSLRFYGVAEHSVLMARYVSAPKKLWALLHDASEAYLADVPRPLKRHLPGYKDAEAAVMAAVCDRFGLPYEMPEEVHEADNRILADEIRQNMTPMDWHAKHDNPLGVTLEFWSPEVAEIHFLDAFKKLTAEARVAGDGIRA